MKEKLYQTDFKQQISTIPDKIIIKTLNEIKTKKT